MENGVSEQGGEEKNTENSAGDQKGRNMVFESSSEGKQQRKTASASKEGPRRTPRHRQSWVDETDTAVSPDGGGDGKWY